MSQAEFLDSLRCIGILAALLFLFWIYEKVGE